MSELKNDFNMDCPMANDSLVVVVPNEDEYVSTHTF